MQKQSPSHAKGETRNPTSNLPLAEGIVPLDKRGRRDWSSMSDEEIVAFAKKVVDAKGIRMQKELQKEDQGLHWILWKRELLDEVGFVEGNRRWASMSDEELVIFSKKFIHENGIRNRGGLARAYPMLYTVLKRKNLLDRVGLRNANQNHRNWASMSDDEIVEVAKKVVLEKRMRYRNGLAKEDIGLYVVLRKRKLLGKVGFEEQRRQTTQRRDWAALSDGELVAFAKRFIEENEVRSRNALLKKDSGLYQALRKRKMLDQVGFEECRRNWAAMSDEELIAFAVKFVGEKKIRSRKGLEKGNLILYAALVRRKLVNEIRFEEEVRDWTALSDSDIVAYARSVIALKGIKSRSRLQAEDSGLMKVLRIRKLLDEVGLEKSIRDWAAMSDDELVAFAKKLLKEKGICSRYRLGCEDLGLYCVLGKRKLRDRVFADIEKDKNIDAVQQVVDALQEFSGLA
jgi:hypothetical protein